LAPQLYQLQQQLPQLPKEQPVLLFPLVLLL
jgi:hypothetical protein